MSEPTIRVPLSLLRQLLAFLERGIGSRRPWSRDRSRLIDALRVLIEGAP